jgi:hypothetical protein
MLRIGRRLGLGLGLMFLPASGFAQGKAEKPTTDVGAATPAALKNMLDCRAVQDNVARLACYDARVAQFAQAQNSGEVTVVDRAEMRRTRRGLFGFSLPDLGLFKSRPKDGSTDVDNVNEIMAKVQSATQNADGGWIVTLEDGARWEQIQAMTFGRRPRPGSTIMIERAALGSFKMKIDSSPWVRARRIG